MTVLQTETPSLRLDAFPSLPAIVDGVVTHQRHERLRRRFRHRVYEWLVDLDDLPSLPRWFRPLASFRSTDHLGDPSLSIKENVKRFLAVHGVNLGAHGRVVMLAHARAFGHVFNPLTVFFCFPDDSSPPYVVAEVHNTYGDRHAYLLRPDAVGRAVADKAMYVSPFFTVDGAYELRFAVSPGRVFVGVTLRRDRHRSLAASFHGTPRPASRIAVLTVVARRPLMTQRVSVLIRAHGVWLWVRRLPVLRRPVHHRQIGV